MILDTHVLLKHFSVEDVAEAEIEKGESKFYTMVLKSP